MHCWNPRKSGREHREEEEIERREECETISRSAETILDKGVLSSIEETSRDRVVDFNIHPTGVLHPSESSKRVFFDPMGHNVELLELDGLNITGPNFGLEVLGVMGSSLSGSAGTEMSPWTSVRLVAEDLVDSDPFGFDPIIKRLGLSYCRSHLKIPEQTMQLRGVINPSQEQSAEPPSSKSLLEVGNPTKGTLNPISGALEDSLKSSETCEDRQTPLELTLGISEAGLDAGLLIREGIVDAEHSIWVNVGSQVDIGLGGGASEPQSKTSGKHEFSGVLSVHEWAAKIDDIENYPGSHGDTEIFSVENEDEDAAPGVAGEAAKGEIFPIMLFGSEGSSYGSGDHLAGAGDNHASIGISSAQTAGAVVGPLSNLVYTSGSSLTSSFTACFAEVKLGREAKEHFVPHLGAKSASNSSHSLRGHDTTEVRNTLLVSLQDHNEGRGVGVGYTPSSTTKELTVIVPVSESVPLDVSSQTGLESQEGSPQGTTNRLWMGLAARGEEDEIPNQKSNRGRGGRLTKETALLYLVLAIKPISNILMFIGDGAKLVRDAFQLAKEKSPCIIFIDEIDAIGTKRFDSEVSGDREVQRTMLELLNQLDGFSSDDRIKVIAATNRADILDPALMRSGRLDRKIELPHPSEEARARILQIHSRKMNVNPDVNFEELARSTDDFNGAQLKAVCVEAGMLALRRDATEVIHEDFNEGIIQVQAKKKASLNYYA
ncbi:hypothetical protein HHK36_021109 [Tetracentron sinense]|uniref:AAA+ ATPase domain-containing protein n=2 Tax=Mesangiospermae TaxID=1437183 RepID=A0A834YRH4_TETSI|nr:hypothetical protein HHK36_021109 [Tetracentron sinense]